MWDCVTGVTIKDNYGCIMADEMVRANLIFVGQCCVLALWATDPLDVLWLLNSLGAGPS